MSGPAAPDHGRDGVTGAVSSNGEDSGAFADEVMTSGEPGGEPTGEDAPPAEMLSPMPSVPPLPPLPEGARVRSHPEIRTLLLTSGELTAWLLDQRTGAVRQLNQAAAAVWALLEEPLTPAELCADLAETFELDSTLAEEVVAAAIEALRTEGLLELTDADGALIIDADTAVETSPSETGSSGVAEDLAHGESADGVDDEAAEERLPALLTRAPDP